MVTFADPASVAEPDFRYTMILIPFRWSRDATDDVCAGVVRAPRPLRIAVRRRAYGLAEPVVGDDSMPGSGEGASELDDSCGGESFATLRGPWTPRSS